MLYTGQETLQTVTGSIATNPIATEGSNEINFWDLFLISY